MSNKAKYAGAGLVAAGAIATAVGNYLMTGQAPGVEVLSGIATVLIGVGAFVYKLLRGEP